jgi:hypothetical protein
VVLRGLTMTMTKKDLGTQFIVRYEGQTPENLKKNISFLLSIVLRKASSGSLPRGYTGISIS